MASEPGLDGEAERKSVWQTLLTLGDEVLIDNEGSTCRDRLARDRNWMQWVRLRSFTPGFLTDTGRWQIRLSTTLAAVATALLLRFRFDDESDDQTPRIGQGIQFPLGCVFFSVAVCAVGAGFVEHWVVSKRMARNMAFVESGM